MNIKNHAETAPLNAETLQQLVKELSPAYVRKVTIYARTLYQIQCERVLNEGEVAHEE